MIKLEAETGTCDLNPGCALVGEWARGVCDLCGQPLDKHLTPEQWARIDADERRES